MMYAFPTELIALVEELRQEPDAAERGRRLAAWMIAEEEWHTDTPVWFGWVAGSLGLTGDDYVLFGHAYHEVYFPWAEERYRMALNVRLNSRR